MTEEQLLETMIRYIKYEVESDKEELLSILRYSIITYDRTTNYTRKSYQYWENVDIRVPIPLLKKAKEIIPKFKEIMREIYIESETYALSEVRIKPKPVELESDENKSHDVVFDEIRETIIQGIRSSKYIVWAAVAWFTDLDIYNELMLRKKEGVYVRIITSKEDSNKFLRDKLLASFDTVLVPTWNNNWNRLHDKFCIIDFEFVMHGSYNWSNNASKNKETLATALDKDFVRKFLDEFITLYNEHKKTQ